MRSPFGVKMRLCLCHHLVLSPPFSLYHEVLRCRSCWCCAGMRIPGVFVRARRRIDRRLLELEVSENPCCRCFSSQKPSRGLFMSFFSCGPAVCAEPLRLLQRASPGVEARFELCVSLWPRITVTSGFMCSLSSFWNVSVFFLQRQPPTATCVFMMHVSPPHKARPVLPTLSYHDQVGTVHIPSTV